MDNPVIVTRAGDWPSDMPGARPVTAALFLRRLEAVTDAGPR